ncbi:MAG: NUDIX domain-containing protein [Symbiobacterium sp.]|uniref:NUDIX domain-containing protein n=1 Tax=Symbiobacterium sp. TaxID=1971213 RepID=UPI003464DC22
MRQKAYALIVENGRLLLVRYYYPKENAWFWNFPGGTVEPGETLEEALRRELIEECCVEVEVGPMLLREVVPGRNYVRHFFRCRIKSGRPRVGTDPATNDSIGALAWVDPTDPGACGGWGRRNLPQVARALGLTPRRRNRLPAPVPRQAAPK